MRRWSHGCVGRNRLGSRLPLTLMHNKFIRFLVRRPNIGNFREMVIRFGIVWGIGVVGSIVFGYIFAVLRATSPEGYFLTLLASVLGWTGGTLLWIGLIGVNIAANRRTSSRSGRAESEHDHGSDKAE